MPQWLDVPTALRTRLSALPVHQQSARRRDIRVKVVLNIVNPSGADWIGVRYVLFPLVSPIWPSRTWQLLVVLVVLVSELVGADQNTSLGVTCPVVSIPRHGG